MFSKIWGHASELLHRTNYLKMIQNIMQLSRIEIPECVTCNKCFMTLLIYTDTQHIDTHSGCHVKHISYHKSSKKFWKPLFQMLVIFSITYPKCGAIKWTYYSSWSLNCADQKRMTTLFFLLDTYSHQPSLW